LASQEEFCFLSYIIRFIFVTPFTVNIYLWIAVCCCAVYEYNLQCRVWQRDFRDRRALQPDVTYYPDLQPPPSYVENAINSVTTRFVKTATNKMRCPIFCMAWTPEGRRLVTGASSGEFTLWNGLTFNFETILQVILFCGFLKNSASAAYDVHFEHCFMHI
jgi:WD40 repeat protein